MTFDREQHLFGLEQAMLEKCQKYEECLIAFSTGTVEEDEA